MIQILREAKEAPAEYQEAAARFGGRNRYGQPNYRIVWGWSRLTWIGGKWTDRDASGNMVSERIELRQEPKYFPFDRWHIERWLPPEHYGSPAEWYALTLEREDGILIPALGPYPHSGDWEHCLTLETPEGGFLPLSIAVIERAIRLLKRSREASWQQRHDALARRNAAEQRTWHARADELLELHSNPTEV